MYTGLLHFHSLLRWILLLLLITAVFKAYSGWTARKVFSDSDRKISLFTLISAHLQLVFGLILYFVSDMVKGAHMDMGAAMKSPIMRYWAVEHILMMIIAIVLITVGHARAKRAINDQSKFRNISVFFGIALVLILIAMPWPLREVGQGRGWF